MPRRASSEGFRPVRVRATSAGTRGDHFCNPKIRRRHRLVTGAITKDTGGELDFHSLSVAVAKTPAEWAAKSTVHASPKCAGGDGLPRRG